MVVSRSDGRFPARGGRPWQAPSRLWPHPRRGGAQVAVTGLVLALLVPWPAFSNAAASAGAGRTDLSVEPADPICIDGPVPPDSTSALETVAPGALPHCPCPGTIDFLISSDRQHEAAYGWRLDSPSPPYGGALAERFETSNGEPYVVCQVVLYLTGSGEPTPPTLDICIWDDDGGRPGKILGMVSGRNLGNVPVWPSIRQKVYDMYDLGLIAVSGPFWAGFWGTWTGDSCSVQLGADLNGPGGNAMTYVPEGLGYPAGWQDVSLVFGQTAALGIGVVVGGCIVPVQPTTWGRIKSLHR
jgi:hypothetical protein